MKRIPKTCIVVPTYNNEDYTIRCFESIARNTKDYVIIWVDDGSNQSSRRKVENFLKREDIPYKLIINRTNSGFIISTNVGIEEALEIGSEYVIFQNNDTEVFDGWLDELIKIANSDEKVGLVGTTASPDDVGQSINNLKNNNVNFSDIPRLRDQQSHKNYANELMNLFSGQSVPINMVAFFSVLIKKDVIADVGKLSEELSIGYGDDDDYCFRAKRNGWDIVIAKGVYVYHEAHSTFYSKYSEKELLEIQKNNLQILNRNSRNRIYELERMREQKDTQIKQKDTQIKQKDTQIKQKDTQINSLVSSKSYRLGSLFFRSIKKPFKWISFPINFFKILLEKKLRTDNDLSQDKYNGIIVRHNVSQNFLKKAQVIQSDKLKVIGIMDEFTYNSFKYECDLTQLTPENWEKEVDRHSPDLLFVESAWRGIDEKWNCTVAKMCEELRDIVMYCRKKNIPTVFWCKEDPIHFDTFIKTASYFDHVFTTDIDCIAKYKKVLKHDRVYLLPFACQPRITNPIKKYDRKDKACFAGAFYNRYPERARDLDTMLDVMGKKYGVDIYDRNYGQNDENYQFPEKYKKYIIGTLPFSKIDKAYKGYRYAINMNSIKQSQTMFARRVLELLASNTVTISNFSRGVRTLFGDLVITSDSGQEIDRRLSDLTSSDVATRKITLQGLRKVLMNHTYRDRFLYICSKAFTNVSYANTLPGVTAVSFVSNSKEMKFILNLFRAQNHNNKKLVLITHIEDDCVKNDKDITILFKKDVHASTVGELVKNSLWVSFFKPGDYYGPNFLTDLSLATLYSNGAYIGKNAYYKYKDNDISLENNASQYTEGVDLQSFGCLIQREEIQNEKIFDCISRLESQNIKGDNTLSIDEFNYCQGAGGKLSKIQKINIDGEISINTGVSHQKLIATSEQITKETLIIGRSNHLILTNIYPTYDELYRNGFVHARVKAYRDEGVDVDVFKLKNGADLIYDEFENIDVIGGSRKHLKSILKTNNYKSVLVHFLDEDMWNILTDHIDNTKIYVWVHGSEIQHWKRRDYNYKNNAEREKAKDASDKRDIFWKSILKEPHSNLKLIFVSQYFANEIMEDLAIKIPKDNYTIIHNCIDTEQFSYEKKSIDQRKKILSIRPFASNKYANDLSVTAIQLLSKKAFFDKLEFRIIGDGILFDEILDPIKHFDNVTIERGFLSHEEIAKLHKEYGIFLVPTRMDAQGVSRDEAMSSGLVSITNNVAAIPEFVDESCGILADADDAQGLADGIERMYNESEVFLRMSAAAAQRVRNQTGFEQTIKKELKLFN